MSDWQQMTDEQLALVRSCGPDERVYVYGDEWIKVSVVRLVSILEIAFKQAYADAYRELAEDVQALDVGDFELGATHMRVTLTGASGKQCVGVGAIPDPRAH